MVNLVFLLTLNNPPVFHYYESLPSWKIYPSSSPLRNHNTIRSSPPEVFCKKGFFRKFAKFTGKPLCQSLFFNKVASLKKETQAQVFYCEFCEISKNTFFTEQLWATASAQSMETGNNDLYIPKMFTIPRKMFNMPSQNLLALSEMYEEFLYLMDLKSHFYVHQKQRFSLKVASGLQLY